MSILRHGASGSARWAVGLTRAMAQLNGIEIRTWMGPRRRRWRGPSRKVVNALQDRIYLSALLPSAARRWGADALLMPVNLTARRDSLPQIATILDVNFMVEPETYDGWYRAYATRMFARSVRDADMLTTISEYSRTQLAAHLGADPTRVRVVYPGLDSVPTMPTVPPPVAPYALFVGATEPHKNLDLIIDAWSTAPPAGLNLVIAGRPGRDHDRILARAARLGARVAIVGAVDQVRLEHLYRQASVFVFPSLVEGFGYPPLEAMARGIPVVASNAASLPEVLGDAARFHDPRDVDALVRHVTELVEDTEVRAAYIARGLDQAARYAWSSTARTMETAIQELIASRTDRLPHRIENAGNHG